MPKDTSNLSVNNISFVKAYRAALIWAAFILFLCLLPGEDLPDIDFWEINIEDKIAHIGVFAILGVLMVWGAWMRGNIIQNHFRSIICILFIGISFGILTEALQGYFVPSRYASLSDAVADAIGVVTGVAVAMVYIKNSKNSTDSKT